MALTPATLDPVKPQVLQPRLAELARISHACSSRSRGRAGLSALRHVRGHPLAGRGYPHAGRTVGPDHCADAVEGV